MRSGIAIGSALAALGGLAGVTAVGPAGAASTGPLAVGPRLPVIRPRHGPPFVPVLGDWEGTADGFAASFALSFDKALRPQAGRPRYAITQLVVSEPGARSACPASPARSEESLLGGHGVRLGTFGSLGLSRLGLGGSLTRAGSATLSRSYRLGSCRGTLRWHMRPAVRRPVQDGAWTARFSSGQRGTFHVVGGGRLATSFPLPRALARCAGPSGRVDLFIATKGGAVVTQRHLRLAATFSTTRVTGSVDSGGRGCRSGPIRFTASTGR